MTVPAVDFGAGLHDDPLDPAAGGRRNPPNIFGHQGAGAAHLPDHGAALDRIDPQRCPVDAGGGRLQTGNPDPHDQDDTIALAPYLS